MSQKSDSIEQGESINLINADIWDDTLLIKAYDESLKLAKEEIAKRIAKSTNKNSIKESDGEEPTLNQSQNEFNIGDYVRATYEDGLDYEAKIISIDMEKGKCLVQFIGYKNEETIDLSNLISSWGKNARKTQMRTAGKYLRGDTDSKRNITENLVFGEMNNLKYNNNLNSSIPIPPPPPMPPMFNDTSEDSENMSAMLMSWYMSGYYTGYYQGRKQAQNKSFMK